jgi:hypothetical protein
MISTLNVGARYFSIFLLCAGPFVGLNIQIAWETTVVPRPRTKRAALIAIANCVSSVSSAPFCHRNVMGSFTDEIIVTGLPLVHPLLLPPHPGAKIPDRWRRDHRRLRPDRRLLSCGQVVGDEEEQETRRAAGVDGRRQPLALRYLIISWERQGGLMNYAMGNRMGGPGFALTERGNGFGFGLAINI